MDELRVDEGKSIEFSLVDVGDNQLIRRGQLWLCACEELVKFSAPFPPYKTKKRVARERDYRKEKITFDTIYCNTTTM